MINDYDMYMYELGVPCLCEMQTMRAFYKLGFESSCYDDYMLRIDDLMVWSGESYEL